MDQLTEQTKSHYEELISSIGEKYIEYRWLNNPISYSHYLQTKRSVELAFEIFPEQYENILEIGCGPGTWTKILLSHCKKLAVVDISERMLETLADKYKGCDIELNCGDFNSDHIELKRKFNIIFSARAIEYMPDKYKMVMKCKSLLKKNGGLIIITKNPNWIDKKIHNKNDKENFIHNHWISHKQLEKIFYAAGLHNVTTFPACFGSYYPILNSSISIKMFNFIHRIFFKTKLKFMLELFSESYMTVGLKRDFHQDNKSVQHRL